MQPPKPGALLLGVRGHGPWKNRKSLGVVSNEFEISCAHVSLSQIYRSEFVLFSLSLHVYLIDLTPEGCKVLRSTCL